MRKQKTFLRVAVVCLSVKNVMLKQGETNWRVVKGQFTAETQRTRRLRREEERGEKSILIFPLRSLCALCASAVNSALHFLRYQKFKGAGNCTRSAVRNGR